MTDLPVRPTIRPGRNFVLALAAIGACSPAVFFWPAAVWPMLVGVAALAIAAADEYRRLRRDLTGLRVTRRLPATVPRGKQFAVAVAVHNDAPAAVSGTLRDILPAVALQPPQFASFTAAPGESVVFTTRLILPVRGRFTFGPVWVRLVGRNSLLEAQTHFECRGAVKALPETFASRENLNQDQRAKLLLLDKLSRTQLQGAGSEFESLAEYRPGDDPRRIDWRTTARIGRPVIRRYQVERHRDVIIAIDCGRLMGATVGNGTKLDCAVDSALMLARVALESGDRCGIGVFDDVVRGFLAPVGGVKSIGPLAEQVYAVESRLRESDFGAMFAELQLRQPRRSLVVIISDLVDAETSERMRASLSRLARRHLVMLAALRTPQLAHALQGDLENLLDASRKAVAFRLLRQRQRALHAVRRSGVYVVDVEPSELTVPLINQFIDLRGRNAL